MLALEREDGQTLGKLANKLGVRPPTVTKTINRLQAQGYVEKRACATDARQANVYLTEEGQAMMRSIEKAVKKTEKQALKGLDKKDQKTLAKLLGRVEANLTGVEIAEVEEAPDAEIALEEPVEVA